MQGFHSIDFGIGVRRSREFVNKLAAGAVSSVYDRAVIESADGSASLGRQLPGSWLEN